MLLTRTIEYRLKGETGFQKISLCVNAAPPTIPRLQPNREYELRECGSDPIQEWTTNDEGEIYFIFNLGAGFRPYTDSL